MDLLIGERIKKYRKNKEMTQDALAQALTVSPQSISKWECGDGYPDIVYKDFINEEPCLFTKLYNPINQQYNEEKFDFSVEFLTEEVKRDMKIALITLKYTQSNSVCYVADGQAMMIVDQGQVVEFTAEPGEYTYDASTEPSIFSGDLGDSIAAVFQTVGKRFTFGGEAPKDQRIYYFNTKEIMGNKYGTAAPVPFRVVDERAAIDMDISVKCFGEYSYKIVNPLLFYKNVLFYYCVISII